MSHVIISVILKCSEMISDAVSASNLNGCPQLGSTLANSAAPGLPEGGRTAGPAVQYLPALSGSRHRSDHRLAVGARPREHVTRLVIPG